MRTHFFVSFRRSAGKGKYFSTNPEYAAGEYGSQGEDNMFAVFVVAVVIGNIVPVSNENEFAGECRNIFQAKHIHLYAHEEKRTCGGR